VRLIRSLGKLRNAFGGAATSLDPAAVGQGRALRTCGRVDLATREHVPEGDSGQGRDAARWPESTDGACVDGRVAFTGRTQRGDRWARGLQVPPRGSRSHKAWLAVCSHRGCRRDLACLFRLRRAADGFSRPAVENTVGTVRFSACVMRFFDRPAAAEVFHVPAGRPLAAAVDFQRNRRSRRQACDACTVGEGGMQGPRAPSPP